VTPIWRHGCHGQPHMADSLSLALPLWSERDQASEREREGAGGVELYYYCRELYYYCREHTQTHLRQILDIGADVNFADRYLENGGAHALACVL